MQQMPSTLKEGQVCIKFPVAFTQIESISLTKAEVKLVKVNEKGMSRKHPVYDWARDTSRQIGKLQGVGINERGYLERTSITMTPDEMVAKIKSIRPEADGYLSVRYQHYVLTDGFIFYSLTYSSHRGVSDWIVTVNKPSKPARVNPAYFYGPAGEGVQSVKNKMPSLPSPYTLSECVVAKYGHALVSAEWLLNFIKDHAELVADPFNWQEENLSDSGIVIPGEGGEKRQYVIIKED